MRFAQLSQGIRHLTDEMRSVTQANRIAIDQEKRLVTWRGHRSGIRSNAYYPMEFQFMLDTQQYSLLLSDQSFFQFYYQFDDEDVLLKARLAYYPVPTNLNITQEEIIEGAEAALEKEEGDIFNHLYNLSELMELHSISPVNTSHVRFDYDSKCETHEPAHIQYGGLNDLRLPADFVPQPLAFVELVHPLLNREDVIDPARLGHARNNYLGLERCEKIIVIGHHL
jgi:hypothetical protein